MPFPGFACSQHRSLTLSADVRNDEMDTFSFLCRGVLLQTVDEILGKDGGAARELDTHHMKPGLRTQCPLSLTAVTEDGLRECNAPPAPPKNRRVDFNAVIIVERAAINA
jgi:hypothetical protein